VFWHVGLAVADIEASMAELGAALGVTFRAPERRHWPPYDLVLTMSQQGPPYIELIVGPPGSPWDASAGPRLHHIARFVDDLDGHRDAIAGAPGICLALDGPSVGVPGNYFELSASGIVVETVASSAKPGLAAHFGLTGL
jgi:hypothetical protein